MCGILQISKYLMLDFEWYIFSEAETSEQSENEVS